MANQDFSFHLSYYLLHYDDKSWSNETENWNWTEIAENISVCCRECLAII